MNARLEAEHHALRQTLARSARAWLFDVSPGLDLYRVEFEVRTLVRKPDRRICEEDRIVRVVYQLDADHPKTQPLVIACASDLFNSHIHDVTRPSALPPLPVFCLGTFHSRMRLADWLVQTYDVLRWARSASEHALDEAAAAWARVESAKKDRFPIDRRSFWEEDASGRVNAGAFPETVS